MQYSFLAGFAIYLLFKHASQVNILNGIGEVEVSKVNEAIGLTLFQSDNSWYMLYLNFSLILIFSPGCLLLSESRGLQESLESLERQEAQESLGRQEAQESPALENQGSQGSPEYLGSLESPEHQERHGTEVIGLMLSPQVH